MAKKTLEEVTKEAQKKYGKGVVGWACEYDGSKIFHTGVISLDKMLPYGGLPGGRIVEIYGGEGSGKTTLIQRIMAEAQIAGKGVVLYDTERRFFPIYARSCGVDTSKEKLSIVYAEYAEQGLQICQDFIRSGTADLIVVDSVAGLVPKKEAEDDVGDWQQGLQARVMGKALRKMLTPLAESGAMIIFVNQLRIKIGTMFGNPETRPGGRALEFFSSVILDVRKELALSIGEKENKTPIGLKSKVTIKKAMGGEGRVCHYDMLFGKGIDTISDLKENAVAAGVVEKNLSIYKYKDRMWRGKLAFIQAMSNDPKLRKEIYDKVRKELKIDEL